MKFLAVIPARGGSRRIPRKNHQTIIPGVTLTDHAIECAQPADAVCVSTDDKSLQWMGRATRVQRPDSMSGPSADIADAARHALHTMEERYGTRYDAVVTLQPAVVARSRGMVAHLLSEYQRLSLRGLVTAARSVPWHWTVRHGVARPSWGAGPYPRSQECGTPLVEVNSVQIASREAVIRGDRWTTPLGFAELPPWTVDLDIDTPADLIQARDVFTDHLLDLEALRPEVITAAEVSHA